MGSSLALQTACEFRWPSEHIIKLPLLPQELVEDLMQAFRKDLNNIRLILLYSVWGLSAVYCYRSYRDRLFLDSARSIWEEANQWAITELDASSGVSLQGKVVLPSDCSGSKFERYRRSTAGYNTNHLICLDPVVGGVLNVCPQVIHLLWQSLYIACRTT